MSECCKYTSGMLRHAVEIQSKARASDGMGGWTDTWAAVSGAPTRAIWGAKPATEQTHAMRSRPGNSIKMVTRHFLGASSSQRVVKDGLEYAVLGVVDPDGRRRWLEWGLTDGRTS